MSLFDFRAGIRHKSFLIAIGRARLTLLLEYTAWTVKFVFNLVLLALFLSIKASETLWNSCPKTEISGQEFHSVSDAFIDKKRVDNTKLNKNLTVHAVYSNKKVNLVVKLSTAL